MPDVKKMWYQTYKDATQKRTRDNISKKAKNGNLKAVAVAAMGFLAPAPPPTTDAGAKKPVAAATTPVMDQDFRQPFVWHLDLWNDDEVVVGQNFLARWKIFLEYHDDAEFPLAVYDWVKDQFHADMTLFFEEVCLNGALYIHVLSDFQRLLKIYLTCIHAAHEQAFIAEYPLRMKNFMGSFAFVHRQLRVQFVFYVQLCGLS